MAPILGIWASSKSTVAADTGAMFPLQVITVGPAGASSVSFTNIPSTYSHLQVRGIARSTRNQNGDYIALQLNSDTGTNYAYHAIQGNGSSVVVSAAATQSFMDIERAAAATASASVFGTFIFDLLDYANTNKYKTVRSLGGFDNNGDGEVYLTSGFWQNTNAVTSLTLKAQNGTSNFAQYSQFALYAVKGA